MIVEIGAVVWKMGVFDGFGIGIGVGGVGVGVEVGVVVVVVVVAGEQNEGIVAGVVVGT